MFFVSITRLVLIEAQRYGSLKSYETPCLTSLKCIIPCYLQKLNSHLSLINGHNLFKTKSHTTTLNHVTTGLTVSNKTKWGEKRNDVQRLVQIFWYNMRQDE